MPAMVLFVGRILLVVALFLSVPYWKDRYFSKSVKKGGARNA